ncbi:hypothetical protein CJD50_22320 [Hafnia paralvei]|uniref:Uncharacterized protein n=1 Tax=Hafnia paralvei TaxID=546367 RepID=A0A2A2M7C5_9GAMM|nr:hypothetical protein [Hafnia paralvei]PAV94172.1 hypothetical protein CJD50_22320 [Hafnia paralvei]
MNNLPIQTYESVVQQRDALEKKLADMAAENAALKASQSEIYDYTQQFTNSDDREMWNAMHDIYKLSSALETPVTDELTRELMAKGVEDAASSLFGTGYSFDLLMAYAAQLRKGINDAQ